MSIFNFFYQFSVDHVIKKDKKHSNVTEFFRSSELRTAAEPFRFLRGFDLVIKPYVVSRYLQYFFKVRT